VKFLLHASMPQANTLQVDQWTDQLVLHLRALLSAYAILTILSQCCGGHTVNVTTTASFPGTKAQSSTYTGLEIHE